MCRVKRNKENINRMKAKRRWGVSAQQLAWRELENLPVIKNERNLAARSPVDKRH